MMIDKRQLLVLAFILLVVSFFAFVLVTGRSTTRVHVFTSPLYAYMPLVLKQAWTDPRFGVAEYGDVVLLGFLRDGRYHSQQWGMLGERDTVFFSRTDHRCLRPNCAEPVPKDWPTPLYCLFTYEVEGRRGNCTGEVATSTGLLDPEGLCEFLQGHPDVSIIVGNEEYGPIGISDDVTPQEYADWYREV